MTYKIQYTPGQVKALAPKFREMLVAIGTKLLSFKEDPHHVKEDMFWDLDGNKFRIHLSSNPLNSALSGGHGPQFRDGVIRACVMIAGGPYVLHLDAEDFDKPIEEVMDDKLLDELVESLITQILYTMAQRWLAANSMVNKMKAMVEAEDYDGIESFTGLDISVLHDKEQFQVFMWHNGKQVYSKSEFNPMKGKESNYYLIACTQALLEAVSMAMVEEHGFKEPWTHQIVLTA